MIQISKTIKQERLRRGMTQEALAEYLNTTKTTISKWENTTLYPNCFIPITLLTLSLGTLNKPKTCRMVGLIAHAMPTFVFKFS
ncbi:hypothetical protein A9958_12890 (plasmid) [Staphylococcus simulans]|uniref:helix-turn-helix domain-containing protein n=1 Tax=Staphylococcus simulans TaxID=1286 RepID=UPI000D0A2970|nr:helix-turn-helix transcriptional regulator [Staphylococcus simulans]AVO03322.1 hypothetical protein BI282_12770 [Staphylococcus simulans]AVO03343.1 hypothetical protein BI282_12885 [Staphylococcus simulans]AVO06393.1 hypothetical protein BI283_13490 [Staphylococcus simulans]AVO06414.1 hypothetical protein BI283_13610 [Staphylococcus simulans]AWG19870.1 hypothetical protein A9958_12775 [Staphylococcus simulans]